MYLSNLNHLRRPLFAPDICVGHNSAVPCFDGLGFGVVVPLIRIASGTLRCVTRHIRLMMIIHAMPYHRFTSTKWAWFQFVFHTFSLLTLSHSYVIIPSARIIPITLNFISALIISDLISICFQGFYLLFKIMYPVITLGYFSFFLTVFSEIVG